MAATSKKPTNVGSVVITGGVETDPQDRGRPVVLIGNALGVTPKVFRDAFSGVTPAKSGPPSPSHARANKKILMDALGKHGVTNNRLDEVSNYYRYRPQDGEIWTFVPATAKATIQNDKVVGIEIIESGSGYTTPPNISIVGYEDTRVIAEIQFSTNLQKNGRVVSLTLK
ncbi:hypothetical protein [Planctomycetes bacterium K23_9]